MREQLFTMNHIGINFPDIDAAVRWYRDVLGCFVLSEPAVAIDDGSLYGTIVKDIFGSKFGKVKIAHVVTACGIGIEMFEFEKPKTYVPENTFDYARAGIFHFCLTTADVVAAGKKVENAGGKILSKTWKLFDSDELRLVYCQDPWGTIIEFYEAPYARTFANRNG